MGRDLPADIYPDEELLECPTLHDRAFACGLLVRRRMVEKLMQGFVMQDLEFENQDHLWFLMSLGKHCLGAGARVRGQLRSYLWNRRLGVMDYER